MVLAIIMTVVAGCGSDGQAGAVSEACGRAWAAFDEVARVPPPGVEQNPGSGAEADATALATLRDCSDPDEWWAASEPYRTRTIGVGVERDSLLDAWCRGYNAAEAATCAAR